MGGWGPSTSTCTSAAVHMSREGGWGPGSGTCTQAVSGRSTSGEEEAAKLLPIFTFLWIHPLLRALYWLHLLMYNLFLERL